MPQQADATANQINPDEEYLLSPEPVAERPAQQDEGGEGYGVPRHDPLQCADLAVK